MKKIKKGDIVYCIRNVHSYHNGVTTICHKCGHYYKTTSESRDYNNGSYVYIESEKNSTSNNQLGFFIEGDKDRIFNDWSFFLEYFVDDIKQVRLKKLKKLKIYENI